jgi:hypothetical protein
MSHISAFTSLALVHYNSPTTLTNLLALLNSIASDRCSGTVLASSRRKVDHSPNSNSDAETPLNIDQKYLKAYCVIITLTHFSISRFALFFPSVFK